MVNKEEIKPTVKKSKKRSASSDVKKIDWDKYFGKIHFSEDGLTYQKRVRDEWTR
jgi:hypothetical protein